jgi:hypothetical protein
LSFGLNQIAIGIRKDIPTYVVDTFDYWLTVLMTCSPTDCPGDNLQDLYRPRVGTGQECGYIANPVNMTGLKLSRWDVVAVILGVVVSIGAGLYVSYHVKLKRQKKRFRKRFVQQIARNINIGPSPDCIPLDKLAEEVQYIGDKDGMITKEKLLKWMFDVKLEFISDRDFDALWAAMDHKNKGEVCAIDFFVFLSACGHEFEEVYHEQMAMPKTERIKWATHRLSNINKLGAAGVQALQFRLERGSSALKPAVMKKTTSTPKTSATTTTSCWMEPQNTTENETMATIGEGGDSTPGDLYDTTSFHRTSCSPPTTTNVSALAQEDCKSDNHHYNNSNNNNNNNNYDNSMASLGRLSPITTPDDDNPYEYGVESCLTVDLPAHHHKSKAELKIANFCKALRHDS